MPIRRGNGLEIDGYDLRCGGQAIRVVGVDIAELLADLIRGLSVFDAHASELDGEFEALLRSGGFKGGKPRVHDMMVSWRWFDWHGWIACAPCWANLVSCDH